MSITRYAIGFYCFALFFDAKVFANDEEHVVSLQTGASIYLSVTPGAGQSQREPGFYTRSSGDWTLAVKGKITIHPQSGAILHQFNVSKIDRRAQSLALVDGYLTIFSQASTPDNISTVARLGDPHTPLFHPLLRSKVLLYPTEDIRNISFYELNSTSESSLIFVSIKSLADTGKTFVFKLNPLDNDRIKIDSPLILIDEKFYSTANLQQLAQSTQVKNNSLITPNKLVSDMAMVQVQQELKPFLGLLTDWLDRAKAQPEKLGRFDLNTSLASLVEQPSFAIGPPYSDSARLIQTFDLSKHQRRIALVEPNSRGIKEVFSGTVDLDHSGKPIFRRISVSQNYIEFISIDNSLHVMPFPRPDVEFSRVLDEAVDLEDFSVGYAGSIKSPSASILRHFVVMSEKHKSGQSRTRVLSFEILNNRVRGLKWHDFPIGSIAIKFLSQDDLDRAIDVHSSATYWNTNSVDYTATQLGRPLNLLESVTHQSAYYGPFEKHSPHFSVVGTAAGMALIHKGEKKYQTIHIMENAKYELSVFEKESTLDDEGKSAMIVIRSFPTEKTQGGRVNLYHVISEEDNLTVRSFTIDSVEPWSLSSTSLKSRIFALKDPIRGSYWVLDTSEKLDKSKLLDLELTTKARHMIFDEKGNENYERNLEAAERTKHIESKKQNAAKRWQEKFPGLSVGFDDSLNVIFPIAPNTPLHIEDWSRSIIYSEKDLFIVQVITGDERNIGLLVIRRSPENTYTGAFLNVDNISVGTSAKFEVVKPLDVLKESKAQQRDFLIGSKVSYEREEKDKDKNESVSPVVRPKTYSYYLYSLALEEESGAIKKFGTIDSLNDITDHLAQFEGQWFWIDGNKLNINSPNLTLTSLSRDERLTPNVRAGRLKRKHIKYLGDWARLTKEEKKDPNDYFGVAKESWLIKGNDLASKINDKTPPNEFARQLFSATIRKIEGYLRQNNKRKPLVLLMPDGLRSIVMAYVSEALQNEAKSWRDDKKGKRLFWVDPRHVDQYSMLENIEAMATVEPENNLLLGDLREMSKTTNPINSDRVNLYNSTNFVEAKESGEVASASQSSHWPHVAFLLASQGNTELSYEDTRSLPRELAFPAMFFGSKEDWKQFIGSDEFLNYGLEEWFDVQEIVPPTADAKIELLKSIFESPSIKNLNFTFNNEGIVKPKPGVVFTPEETRQSVLRYAVNRVETLSKGIDDNQFNIYFRFVSNLTQALVQDRAVRLSKKVDKPFIERVLTKIFNIPLNRNYLLPDDPLLTLSRPDAALKFQEAGYDGRMSLKLQLVDVLKSPLNPAQAKTIPASLLLVGDSGTGKTRVFESLTKMLRLKVYDFTATDETANQEANAIIIRADKILPMSMGATSGGSTLTIEQALAHLDYFWSLPNGHRGYIFIDDLHAAPAEVRTQLLVYLRGLFESPNALYTTKAGQIRLTRGNTIDVPEVTRPIKGVTLISAMNLTENMQELSKFVKAGETPTLNQRILATLSTPQQNLETSWLKRWSSIVLLGDYPIEAKAPGLIDAFLKKMQSLLELKNKFAFLAPESAKIIAAKFSNLDARTFLTEPTNALYDMIADDMDPSALQIVVPATNSNEPENSIILSSRSAATATESGNFAQRNSQIFSVSKGSAGQLHLLKLLVNSFRIRLFEFWVQSLQEDPNISMTPDLQRQFLFPILQALHDHVIDHESMPLREVTLDPIKFGATTREQRETFQQLISQVDGPQKSRAMFPISFSQGTSIGRQFQELTGQRVEISEHESRRSVLSRYATTFESLISRELSSFFRVEDLRLLPKTEKWVESMKTSDPKSALTLAKKMSELYLEFRKDLYADNLVEVIQSENFAPLTSYGVARLFLYTIERAITRLPWSEAVVFFSQATETAIEDLVLSQSPGFQFLLNGSKYTPFRPQMSDHILAMVANFPAFDEDLRVVREKQKTRFDNDCARLLSSPARGAR